MEVKRTLDSWKNRSLIIVTYDCAPNDNFLIGAGFIPSVFNSPSNVAPQISNLLKSYFCLGRRGEVTNFTNITRKQVPTLLSSTAEKVSLECAITSIHTNSSTLETKVTAMTLHASMSSVSKQHSYLTRSTPLMHKS